MKKNLTLDLIREASDFLRGKILRTPLEFSPRLSELVQAPVYLKLESQQITGSFKVRGALFYLSTLNEDEKQNGVAVCSAGNHGLGVAFAAKQMNVPCTVYVPKMADEVKKKKILDLGAAVIESEFIGYDESLIWAKNESRKARQHFVTAFDDPRIMAANGGSLALEIMEDLPDVQNVIFPVGGGGLGAGLSYYFKSKNPTIKLIGCQHIESPGLHLSLQLNKAVTELPPIATIAGGLEGGIGEACFEVLKGRIDGVSLVSEKEIIEACRWILEHHQCLIEPTAAVTLAACITHKYQKSVGKTVIILTGRNVSFATLKKIL